ncbi:hypothetical protein EMVG_00185 [Emiliania huxleyi virus PS401]|nr:hypothetical protein EMVG_00185 [Emiliania huxleyi virus PS401]
MSTQIVATPVARQEDNFLVKVIIGVIVLTGIVWGLGLYPGTMLDQYLGPGPLAWLLNGEVDGQRHNKFVYEFYVNVPSVSAMHLAEVTVDGSLLPPGSWVVNIPGDRDNTGSSDTLSDGTNAGINYNAPQNIYDLVFTVTLDQQATYFSMTYSRPIYAPGWIIKENGQEVYVDYDNHGSVTEPIYPTYDYYLRQ